MESPTTTGRLAVEYTPAHLAERIRAQQQAMEARGAEGERKTITVLFADLKGSTALLEGLDPEVARGIIDPALQIMMDAVHRYEGYVAQALGDGILALFGAPLAHEDHAQRAALRMQEELRSYSDQVRLKQSASLAMRVGLNTGEVVVRSIRKDDLHTDYVPVGHSINLAARMEQIAAPGSILITEYTQKLIEGYFSLKALGAADIKGVERPIPVYEVLGVGQLRTRLQVAARRGLTRFVGRQQELTQMQTTLAQARDGRGQVIGIMGEPGMGKSRLVHEFKLSATGFAVFEAFSASHGKATPYLPITELLKGYFQIQLQDDERTRREKIIGKTLGLDRNLEDVLPFYFALLNIDDPDSPLPQMDPQLRRRKTFEALKRATLRASVEQPVLMIFEDLHWIDSETQGYLDSLVESIGSARILLLTSYRPEYRHEWGGKSYCTQLRVAPFGRIEAEEFLTILLGEATEATESVRLSELRQMILAKTEGTPFFMEEVVQELFEQGVLSRDNDGRTAITDRAVTNLHIPATVQGVLAARIDRLGADEKALLQHLAVIGREFSLNLALRVVEPSEEELHRLLGALQRKEFLYEQPAFPEVEFIFKHALTQEVAYHSLLQERRKVIHERTALAIEAAYQSELDDHYGDLAHHYSRSGNLEKAIEYLEKAGLQATRQAAAADAVNYIRRALEHLAQVETQQGRERDELRLLLALLGPLRMVKGMAAHEVQPPSLRVRELSERVGDPLELFHALAGLRNFYTMRGDFRAALKYAQEMRALAEREDNEVFAMYAQVEIAVNLLYLGEVVECLPHFARVRELYAPDRHRSTLLTYGFDACVIANGMAAQALWVLGYPAHAITRSDEALAHSRQVSHPFMIGYAMLWGCMVRVYRRDVEACRAMVEQAYVYANEHGFPDWVAIATMLHGWVAARDGNPEGAAELERGIAAYSALSSELALPLFHSMAGEAHLIFDDPGHARRAIEGGLTIAIRNSEGLYLAELRRLQGEIALREPGDVATSQRVAEAHYLEAIAVAQKQHAKSWELRATLSLAKLWLQQGRTNDAHERLATIYDWFTEGFDTPDLIEARTLLDGP